MQTRADDCVNVYVISSPLGEIRGNYFGEFIVSFPLRPMVGRRKECSHGHKQDTAGGLAGMKKPRLTAMERLAIETGLDAGKTPYAIAQELGRPPKTVMREIRGRAVESDKGAVGRVNNRCTHRYECTRRDVIRSGGRSGC